MIFFYKLEYHSLLKNSELNKFHSSSNENNDEVEEEVPQEIEEIIQYLLDGLKEKVTFLKTMIIYLIIKDTIIRWSAAKGIGRITSRLTKEFGDDIVTSLLELFSCIESFFYLNNNNFFKVGENDEFWHGGCLALAELSRRGLLLPKRLNDVIPVILKVLNIFYEKFIFYYFNRLYNMMKKKVLIGNIFIKI